VVGYCHFAETAYIDSIAINGVVRMGNLTIRNIDDAAHRNARLEAARNGRSLEAELRALVERTYGHKDHERAARIRAMSGREFIGHLIATAGGADLELPVRTVDSEREIFGAD
jgi:plasmid stability protein